MNRFATFARNSVIPAGAMVLAGHANAAAIDVSDVVTDIAAQATPVASIGAAILVLMVGIKAFKWVRKAMS